MLTALRQTPAVSEQREIVVGGRLCRSQYARRAGFSVIEILVVIGLMAMLILAALNTVTLLDRSSRRQALQTTAMELAQGRIESLQTNVYNPPVAPFGATATTQTSSVILVLNKTGTNTLVSALMTTIIAPATQGHLVTVTVATTNANQPMNAQLQTVINDKSGNQP